MTTYRFLPLRAAAAIAAAASLLAAAPVADAATRTDQRQNRRLTTLERKVRALESANRTLRTRLDALVGCLVTVNIARYGDPSTGLFGYSYANGTDPPFLTSAIDATGDPAVGVPMVLFDCTATTQQAAARGPRAGRGVPAPVTLPLLERRAP